MINRICEQIQERLNQLEREADQLRKALAALAPVSSAPSSRAPTHARSEAPSPQRDLPAPQRARARRGREPTAGSRRTAPGAMRAAVLAALPRGEALTAGQVADQTGLPRATVSTTLTKLAKSGDVQKAERGYLRTEAEREDVARVLKAIADGKATIDELAQETKLQPPIVAAALSQLASRYSIVENDDGREITEEGRFELAFGPRRT